jgi:TetR/AcrR family transcriptional regulator, mexJK operon transcriptional repressor
MPPRDEQDYEQRRQQIIDGALEAFAAKGFEGASNKDIAQAAKIASPGLIYHYFKDKVDLLHQMLEARMPVLRVVNEAEGMLDQPPEEALLPLALKILRAYEQWPSTAIIKVVIVEAVRNPRVAKMVAEIGPGRGLRVMSRYLARQMELGRLRRMNPDVATRAFIGPLIAYTLMKSIFDDPESRSIPVEEMARSAIGIFLRGMAPEG